MCFEHPIESDWDSALSECFSAWFSFENFRFSSIIVIFTHFRVMSCILEMMSFLPGYQILLWRRPLLLKNIWCDKTNQTQIHEARDDFQEQHQQTANADRIDGFLQCASGYRRQDKGTESQDEEGLANYSSPMVKADKERRIKLLFQKSVFCFVLNNETREK